MQDRSCATSPTAIDLFSEGFLLPSSPMRKFLPFMLTALACCSGIAAERAFDFGTYDADKPPTNFVSMISGEGKPGDWKIVEDEVPPLLSPLTPNAMKIGKRQVLGQLSQEETDEHFPILVIKDD